MPSSAAAPCRIRVLGPLEVRVGAAWESPQGGGGALLAVLAAYVGATVPVERLADALWPTDPPHDPVNAVQVLVSRLRARLGRDLIETRPGGYRLAASAALDSLAFEALLRDTSTADPTEAVVLLRRAGALWRGPAFTPYDDLPGVREESTRLHELRLVARERLARALLDEGRYDEVVADAESLVLAHPLREQSVEVLVTALARTGRAAEALGRLADLRAQLRESGLDPSARIDVLQQRVLAGDLGPPTSASGRGEPLALVCRRFSRAPGEAVTYGEAGAGPETLVFVPGWVSRLDALTTGVDPRGRVLAVLAEQLRVVTYDRFGTGLSPGAVDDFALEPSVAELGALLDAIDAERVVLFGSSAASPIAVAAAARDPRVERLVLLGGYADGPALFSNQGVREAMVGLVRSSWGVGSRILANLVMPDRYDEKVFARFQLQAAGAEVAAGFLQQMYDADVTDLLPQVRQPTLVLHYADDPAVPLAGGRQVAEAVVGARLRVLKGASHLPPARDAARIAEEILSWCRTGASGPR